MAVDGRANYNSNIDGVTYLLLSTDEKPTALTFDTIYELNTGKTWIFSAKNINPVTSNGWWEVL